MKKLLMVVIALALVAGFAYAADQAKKVLEPVTTVVEDTGVVANTAAQGTIDTLNLNNNPITTAAEVTKTVVEETAKTVTFQKVDKKVTK